MKKILSKSRLSLLLCIVMIVCIMVNLVAPLIVLAADSDPLSIVSVTPANQAINVPLNSDPTIVFNRAVNTSTLTGSVNGNPIISLQTVFDSSNLTLKIDLGDMSYQTLYTIVIKASLSDTNGISMAGDYSFSFTTAAGFSKVPMSTLIVPDNVQPGNPVTISGHATGYIWQKDVNNPLELRYWDKNGNDIGSMPVLHPTVLYFPNGINGYKFYLVYTPAGQSDENPCLMRSNDGVNFVATGVTNPLLVANTQPVFDSQNLADPELAMVGNTWMLFYEMEQTNYGHIGVAFSSDGVHYSPYGGNYNPPKEMLPFPTDGNPVIHFSNDTWYEHDTDPTDNFPRLGEPAVIFKDGEFQMWYGDFNPPVSDTELAIYANATDPKGPWLKTGPVLS